jgi:hypothetical protein
MIYSLTQTNLGQVYMRVVMRVEESLYISCKFATKTGANFPTAQQTWWALACIALLRDSYMESYIFDFLHWSSDSIFFASNICTHLNSSSRRRPNALSAASRCNLSRLVLIDCSVFSAFYTKVTSSVVYCYITALRFIHPRLHNNISRTVTIIVASCGTPL